MSSTEKAKWEEAMKLENKSLSDNDEWELLSYWKVKNLLEVNGCIK